MPLGDHDIAGPDVRQTVLEVQPHLPDVQHRSAEFTPQSDGRPIGGCRPPVPVHDVQVGAADAGSMDLDQRLAGREPRHRPVDQLDGARLGGEPSPVQKTLSTLVTNSNTAADGAPLFYQSAEAVGDVARQAGMRRQIERGRVPWGRAAGRGATRRRCRR
jgi:hypothetical protein